MSPPAPKDRVSGGAAPLIRRMWGAGWPVRDIARLYGVRERAVREFLGLVPTAPRRKGKRRRRRGVPPAAGRRARLIARARLLRAEGWTLPELAERFGVAKSTAWRWAPEIPKSSPRSQPARLDDVGAPPFVAPPWTPPEGPPGPPPEIGPEPGRPSARPAAVLSAPPGSPYGRRAVGSAHGRAKLSEADAAELRLLREKAPKRWTYGALASRYGVSKSTVFHVLDGRTWRHVPGGRRADGAGS